MATAISSVDQVPAVGTLSDPMFPAAPPKIPYVGFSHSTAQSSGASQLAPSPSLNTCPELRLIPTTRSPYSGLTRARDKDTVHTYSQLDVWEVFLPCLLLNPEVLAPAGLCCPGLHHFSTSSAGLATSIPFPDLVGYRDGLWHSRIILPGPQTFRAFVAKLSRIAAFNVRREPDTCTSQFLRCRHWPSGSPDKPLALQYSYNQFHVGGCFRRFVRSLSLRPSCLLAPLDWSA